MDKKIRCIGGITIDRKLTPTNKLQLGTSNPVVSESAFGGVAHNVAKNLALLTNNIHLYSVVGQDNHGLHALEQLAERGIDVKNIQTIPNKPTAHYDVILDTEGELFLALADMDIFDHVPFKEFTQYWNEWGNEDIIFLDTNLPASIIEYAIQLGRTKNIKICIDPVSPIKAKKLPANLEHVFLLKPDRLEAEALTQMRLDSPSDCIKAGRLLLNKGVANCIISLGKSGYVLVNERIQKQVPAFSIDSTVDVTGAGDAFIAGILYELKQQTPLVEACRTGAAMAALTLQSCHSVNEQINSNLLKNILLRETNDAPIF